MEEADRVQKEKYKRIAQQIKTLRELIKITVAEITSLEKDLDPYNKKRSKKTSIY